jgi:hypothetical protein
LEDVPDHPGGWQQSRRRRRRLGHFLKRAAAALLLCGAALAHDVPHPRRELLRISPDGLRLLVDYEVAAGEPARSLRQAFDRDRSGTLDPGEQQALADHLARTATLRTELLIDGGQVPLRREAVRPEKVDEPPSSTALLAVRVELSAALPPAKKNNFFFANFLDAVRRVELRDLDQTGHVPVAVECERCEVSDASSGVAEKNGVRGAETPLRLRVRAFR